MKLIFIHGSAGYGGLWHKQTAHFHDSEAITLPGHPDGEPLDALDAIIDWLHSYFSSRNYREIVLCGHSLGGGLAMAYALEHPKCITGLVLADATARTGMPKGFHRDPEGYVSDVNGYLIRLKEHFRRMPPHERDIIIMRMLAVGTAGRLADMTAMKDFDVTSRLGEIKAPVKIITGSDDMTPATYFEQLAAGVPRADWTVIQGAGHYPMLDRPDEFNRALAEFLGSL
jgi:3-oxoadipate enol-lactonase